MPNMQVDKNAVFGSRRIICTRKINHATAKNQIPFNKFLVKFIKNSPTSPIPHTLCAYSIAKKSKQMCF